MKFDNLPEGRLPLFTWFTRDFVYFEVDRDKCQQFPVYFIVQCCIDCIIRQREILHSMKNMAQFGDSIYEARDILIEWSEIIRLILQ